MREESLPGQTRSPRSHRRDARGQARELCGQEGGGREVAVPHGAGSCAGRSPTRAPGSLRAGSRRRLASKQSRAHSVATLFFKCENTLLNKECRLVKVHHMNQKVRERSDGNLVLGNKERSSLLKDEGEMQRRRPLPRPFKVSEKGQGRCRSSG